MKENIYDFRFDAETIENGLHRSAIGGLWEEMGRKQLDFMIGQGLKPSDDFLDLGCGCLRGGVHFIQYLDANKYYGFDINQSLLDAGYDVELARLGLQEKFPRSHLLANDGFRLGGFKKQYKSALDLSLFSHLTINSIRACLFEVSKVMDKGGRFYSTAFLVPNNHNLEFPAPQSEDIITYMDRDPYHYLLDDMIWLGSQASFDVQLLNEFKHPRNQKMLVFIRR